VTASDGDTIKVYDTQKGEEAHVYHSRKYGVANVAFTHDPLAVIYSSTHVSSRGVSPAQHGCVDETTLRASLLAPPGRRPSKPRAARALALAHPPPRSRPAPAPPLPALQGNDHAWRYHDLHDNRYVRYFRGHTGRVTTLCQSPKTDQVLSAGEDKQVRLWDLRSGVCTAMLQAPGLPTVAFDEQGLVFCVGAESGVVKLYDARNYASGPFNTFVVEDERNSAAVFAVLRFSLDGKCLLAVVEGRIYVLDAFEGAKLCKVASGVPDGGSALEACLTADGRYVLSGCGDRAVRVWRVDSGAQVAEWQPQHADTPACLKFSPRKMLVASACRALHLWTPDPALRSRQQQGWPPV
jgi:COMPASS component SWD2